MIAPTDKEVIVQLRAQVADLTEEVEAWRAHDRDGAKAAITTQREAEVRSRVLALKPSSRAGVGFGGAIIRLLIVFMDNPGRLLTKHEIYKLIVSDVDAERDTKTVDVRVCHVRHVLQWCGLPRTGVETVWGRGYRLQTDAAERLKEVLEPDAAQAVAA